MNSTFVKISLTLLSLVLIIFGYLFFAPVTLPSLKDPKPTETYAEAKNAISSILSKDDSSINEKCKSIFFDQGKKVDKVIVFFHGFTNCPAQFEELGKKFFAQGYNVFIPRLPYHGFKDRLTDEPTKLTAMDLITATSEDVSAIAGLGEEVIVGGISGGGVMAAWAGYHYKFVDKVLLISPLFLGYDLPENAFGPLMRTKSMIPFDLFKWWDDSAKENIAGPKYAYPHFSFKASFEFLNLSYILNNDLASDKDLPNKNLQIIYITSENDKAVRNSFGDNLIKNWSDKLGREAATYQFPSYYNFNHDIIDPNQTTAKPEIVYPKVFEMVNK